MNHMDRSIVEVMSDGTQKQINPFTGTEVWYIPGRKNRPLNEHSLKDVKSIDKKPIEDYCNFCPANYFQTPPEKSRITRDNHEFIYHDRIDPQAVFQTLCEFRRIPNLFEIVTIDYWKKNFSYQLSDKNQEWKARYLDSEKGREHVTYIINLKLKYAGLNEQKIREISLDQKFEMADAFFGGGHELIVPRRHYEKEAEFNTQLAAAGTLTQEEHYQYFKFTIQTMQDIFANNRYVRYIAVYQNWLKAAGASFDHLHKQLVALDEWGVSLEREIELAYKNPNIYNEAAVNYAGYNNNVVCENDHAVAFVEPGHRHPTIAIYSKSVQCKPAEHSDAELKGMSDIVHAIHAATGSTISCNEEWYYMPRDSVITIPWHVMIKWRINVPAGFEGGTKIYVNPMSLKELRDTIVPKLYDLRSAGHINNLYIAEECPVKPNSLNYYKNIK